MNAEITFILQWVILISYWVHTCIIFVLTEIALFLPFVKWIEIGHEIVQIWNANNYRGSPDHSIEEWKLRSKCPISDRSHTHGCLRSRFAEQRCRESTSTRGAVGTSRTRTRDCCLERPGKCIRARHGRSPVTGNSRKLRAHYNCEMRVGCARNATWACSWVAAIASSREECRWVPRFPRLQCETSTRCFRPQSPPARDESSTPQGRGGRRLCQTWCRPKFAAARGTRSTPTPAGRTPSLDATLISPCCTLQIGDTLFFQHHEELIKFIITAIIYTRPRMHDRRCCFKQSYGDNSTHVLPAHALLCKKTPTHLKNQPLIFPSRTLNHDSLHELAVVQPLQTLLAPLRPTPRAKKDEVSSTFTEFFTLSTLPTLYVLIFNSKNKIHLIQPSKLPSRILKHDDLHGIKGVRHSAFAKPYLLRSIGFAW